MHFKMSSVRPNYFVFDFFQLYFLNSESLLGPNVTLYTEYIYIDIRGEPVIPPPTKDGCI
jgi:hypothetical protein